MATLASTTFEEKWQERLKEVSSTPSMDLKYEASSSPENVSQDNEDDCYGMHT